jgi:hypothetical protein
MEVHWKLAFWFFGGGGGGGFFFLFLFRVGLSRSVFSLLYTTLRHTVKSFGLSCPFFLVLDYSQANRSLSRALVFFSFFCRQLGGLSSSSVSFVLLEDFRWFGDSVYKRLAFVCLEHA